MLFDEDPTYYTGSGIPKGMLGVFLHEVKPQNADQETLKTLLTELKKARAEDDNGFNTLLLLGNTGLGKTYMSQALANMVIHNAVFPENAARYITHYELDMKLKSVMNSNYNGPGEYDLISKYKMYGLLIIDEFGRGSTSEFTMTKIEHILTERMMRGKRTIIISNRKPDELREFLDFQMQDRFGIMEGGSRANDLCKTFLMGGKSLRGSL